MSASDRALVASIAEVAEAFDRVVMMYGRAGDLEIVGSTVLRKYGDGAAKVAAEMVARADQIDDPEVNPRPPEIPGGTSR